MKKQKEFKMVVTYKDGSVGVVMMEADNLLDAHYRLYRELGRGGYEKAYVDMRK